MATSLPQDKIGSALNLTPLTPSDIGGRDVVVSPNVNSNNQIEDDYEYARGNLIAVIEKGNEALNGILDVAGMSQHPRAYEVAANLVKTMSDASKDLMELAKRKKDLDKPTEAQQAQRVTNNMFVGSTAELLKAIKQNQ
jgi:hypothetical protein